MNSLELVSTDDSSSGRSNLQKARKRSSKQSLLTFEPDSSESAFNDYSRPPQTAVTFDPSPPQCSSWVRPPGMLSNSSSTGRVSALRIGSIRTEFGLDWLAVFVCVIVLAISDRAPPREAYIPKALLEQTNFPLLPNSVPAWSVPVYALLAPAVFFALHTAVFKRPVLEAHHHVLGVAAAVLLTGVVTNCLKIPVGRLRPDFNERCWPDGKILWAKEDAMGGYAKCTGDPGSIAEGRKSFPSGHSSWSAAGLCYVMYFLFDRLQVFKGGHPWRLLVASLPGIAALAAGVSRYTDYWHYPSDVVAGLLLGGSIAWLCYKQQQMRLVELDPDCYGSALGNSCSSLQGPVRSLDVEDGETVPLSTLAV